MEMPGRGERAEQRVSWVHSHNGLLLAFTVTPPDSRGSTWSDNRHQMLSGKSNLQNGLYDTMYAEITQHFKSVQELYLRIKMDRMETRTHEDSCYQKNRK